MLSTLVLVVPLLDDPIGALPVALVVLALALVVTDGPAFDLFAYPQDYEDGRLYGLFTFALAATTLGLLAAESSMPTAVFVASVLLVGFGNLGDELAGLVTDHAVARVVAFCLLGGVSAIAGHLLTRTLEGLPLSSTLATVVFLAAGGVLLAALLRDVLFQYDDPVVVLAVGFLGWLLVELDPAITTTDVALALAVTVAVGYVSFALGAASVAGMLTGVLLSLLTIVLGGYDWFAVLITFFAIGSLSTKFRYEEKRDRGVAEENDGARGSSNVLGNAAVALAAVLGYAASSAGVIPVDEPALFLFAFAGSLATALSDTLSSEIGGVFDSPRLITTLEPVEPGTDGGVTWQGEVAGLAGATVVALISYVFFTDVGGVGAAIIVAAGFAGMTVDSLLGATVEGNLVGNQGVNFLATLSGALVGALLLLSIAVLG
ncbi:TIGR00297 family protein [Natronobiforma cellulositropha]